MVDQPSGLLDSSYEGTGTFSWSLRKRGRAEKGTGIFFWSKSARPSVVSISEPWNAPGKKESRPLFFGPSAFRSGKGLEPLVPWSGDRMTP